MQSIPTDTYFAAINNLYDQGEYVQALKQFQAEWQHGEVKSAIQPQWIDSICYHTMMGECYYQMGELDQALDQYTSAVRLYLMFPDWMIRVVFPASIRPSSSMPQIPWGPSMRRAFKGFYPATMSLGQGRIDASQQVMQGGIVQPPMLLPIHVQEIVRCTILAIRRRTELMGPLCQVDATTGQLIAALSARPAPPNHWSQTWVEVELAMALIAGGRQARPCRASAARSWPGGSSTIPSPRPCSWSWAAWPCCAATTSPPRDRSSRPRSRPWNILTPGSWRKRSATRPSRTSWPTSGESIHRWCRPPNGPSGSANSRPRSSSRRPRTWRCSGKLLRPP